MNIINIKLWNILKYFRYLFFDKMYVNNIILIIINNQYFINVFLGSLTLFVGAWWNKRLTGFERSKIKDSWSNLKDTYFIRNPSK